MATVFSKRNLRDFDWVLAALAIGIVIFGTLQIRNAQPTEPYWQKQLIGLGIALVSIGISFIATIYPSWSAARILPAEALRYE